MNTPDNGICIPRRLFDVIFRMECWQIHYLYICFVFYVQIEKMRMLPSCFVLSCPCQTDEFFAIHNLFLFRFFVLFCLVTFPLCLRVSEEWYPFSFRFVDIVDAGWCCVVFNFIVIVTVRKHRFHIIVIGWYCQLGCPMWSTQYGCIRW